MLVETWPDAVKEKTINNGDLPLHLACYQNAPLDVIKLLVETWPDSVKEKNKFGNTPLALAKNARTISWSLQMFGSPSSVLVEFDDILLQ